MEAAAKVTAGPGANSLGKYRLIAELGHGGMAEVFLAVVRGPAGFNKLIVVKQIRPQLAEDPEFLGMFLDEARLAARLSHPNVVQTNEVGQEGDRYFIAMEYLEGQPLNRVIHRLGRATGMPLNMHVKVLLEVCAGLHHAHELADYDGTPLSVVHRDVTPHNIFLTYDGLVKVVDFGIAKAMNSSSETRTGVLKGKVAYMAPEQARGERVDRRADLFSVGVMLWEAATGKRLWKGIPDITILQRLLAGEIPTPRSIKPEIPEKLDEIIQKAMAHQREERYETAADLQYALEQYLMETGEHVQTRDIGKLVASHFEADRAKIKAIVDEQLRTKATSMVEGLSLPVIDPGQSMSSTENERVSIDSSPSRPGAGSGPKSTSYTAPSVLFASSAAAATQGGSRRGLVAGGAVLAGAVLAIGFWVVAKGPATEVGGPAAGSSGAASAAASAAPSAAAEVEVKLAALPADAKLFLDDKPLEGNPWKGKLPRDGATHKLRVEAAGYTTQNESVVLDRDKEMKLVLEKDAGSQDKKRTASQPAAQVPQADDAMTRPAVKPKRNIDATNPYQK